MTDELSWQAKLTRKILRTFRSRQPFSPANIVRRRKSFARNVSWLFPKPWWAHVEPMELHGISGEWVSTRKPAERTILYFHGGGFCLGSPKTHRRLAAFIARACQAKVLVINYRLAPEHPFPAALDDIETIWRALLENPASQSQKVTFMGDSAGGNLALAAALRLRDKGLTLPGCIVMLSPGVDGTLSGQSMGERSSRDPLLTSDKLQFFADSYLQNTPKDNPLASPIFANLRDLPPMLLHVGTEEMLFSDSQTIANNAKRDGSQAELVTSQGLWHVWHFFTFLPESKRAFQNIATFIRAHTGA